MTKKLELKFLTSANTELLVSIADPKDGLALSAVQAEAAKIMPVLANGKGVGAASFRKGCHGDHYGRGNSLILKEVYNKDIWKRKGGILMAVSKSVEKTRLLVRVENTDGSLKNLAFNNIRESASDEELLHAGKAIAGLQVKALDSVRRSDVAVLTDGE